MAWYYYNGDKPLPVKVGKGEVESVRPHTMVHVDDAMDSHPETLALVARRVLIRRGAPKAEKPKREVVMPVADLPKEQLATDFTRSFVEKGDEPIEDKPEEKAEEKPKRTRRKRRSKDRKPETEDKAEATDESDEEVKEDAAQADES